MTATSKTDLVAIRTAIAEPKVSFVDVLDAIAERKRAAATPAPLPVKAIGKVAPISKTTKDALRALANDAEKLELPTEARQMTDAERTDLIKVYLQAKEAEKQAKKIVDAIQLAVHNHLDAEAVAAGRKADLDTHNHLALAGVFGAPDQPKVIKREERGGNAVPTTVADLRQMEADGVITHTEFLGLTVREETRAVDHAAMLRRMGTDDAFLKALVGATRVSPKSTALSVRDAGSAS